VTHAKLAGKSQLSFLISAEKVDHTRRAMKTY
jgi:hypothetical protein